MNWIPAEVTVCPICGHQLSQLQSTKKAKPSLLKKIGLGAIGFFFLCIVASVIGSLFGGDGGSKGSEEPVVAAPTETTVPLVADTPTVEPPTATAVPLSMRDRLLDAVGGESNRGVADRLQVDIVADVLSVRWAINDNLSSGLIVAGAWLDVARMMAVIYESGEEYGLLRFEGTFGLVDGFGNQSESMVLSVSVSRETMGKINWADSQWVDTILYQRLPEIADAVNVHPAFQE